MSADAIVPGAGNPQALNRYAYVYNNPLNYVDPTGHDGCTTGMGGDYVCGGGGGSDVIGPGGDAGVPIGKNEDPGDYVTFSFGGSAGIRGGFTSITVDENGEVYLVSGLAGGLPLGPFVDIRIGSVGNPANGEKGPSPEQLNKLHASGKATTDCFGSVAGACVKSAPSGDKGYELGLMTTSARRELETQGFNVSQKIKETQQTISALTNQLTVSTEQALKSATTTITDTTNGVHDGLADLIRRNWGRQYESYFGPPTQPR